MIEFYKGDMFKTKCDVIVNTVNCYGVMGKGIALECRKRYPDMYLDYVKKCADKEVKVGQPYLFKGEARPWVLNFPTKNHWRNKSEYSYIISGLEYLRQHLTEWQIESIAIPPLGCGEGKLNWILVKSLIYNALRAIPIIAEVYAPLATSATQASGIGQQVAEQSPDYQHHTYFDTNGMQLVTEIIRQISRNKYHIAITNHRLVSIIRLCALMEFYRSGLTSALIEQVFAGTEDIINQMVGEKYITRKKFDKNYRITALNRQNQEGSISEIRRKIAETISLLFMFSNNAQSLLMVNALRKYEELRMIGQPISEDILMHEVISMEGMPDLPYIANDTRFVISQLSDIGLIQGV